MATQRTSGSRANVLDGREIVVRATRSTSASPGEVWDVLAELTTHLEWGSGPDPKKGRLLSLDAPGGAAGVGTEFTSTGEDRICRMRDHSVITEATAPRVLEFVTESGMVLKKSGASTDFTVVHRYDIEPEGTGSRVTHGYRITRASDLPGPLRLLRTPVLRAIPRAEAVGEVKHGLKNLLEMVEGRSAAS